MKRFRVAILGCGTVGGGVAKILLQLGEQIAQRNETKIEIAKIADIFPAAAAKRHGIPRDLFCGTADELTKEESNKWIQEIIADPTIDLVVETIGGTSKFLLDIMLNVLKAKKHLVTANKAMLAHHGDEIFAAAEANGVSVGFEASVCGAIPIIKAVRECFTGDKINSVCGIMNGT
ncbi:MAG: homoserine dehydrogenase, partial [Spirochaetales bacterium]|nr:homoserine dehydrogenase [Spirochaetales bacterium]